VASSESGSFVVQLLQFHLEAPDVLVEFHFPFLLLSLVVRPIAVENGAPYLQQLPLPLAELMGMHAVLAG
jgi:hypothetical protein